MRIVYRMRGLLGDATEEFIECLDSTAGTALPRRLRRGASGSSRSEASEVLGAGTPGILFRSGHCFFSEEKYSHLQPRLDTSGIEGGWELREEMKLAPNKLRFIYLGLFFFFLRWLSCLFSHI